MTLRTTSGPHFSNTVSPCSMAAWVQARWMRKVRLEQHVVEAHHLQFIARTRGPRTRTGVHVILELLSADAEAIRLP